MKLGTELSLPILKLTWFNLTLTCSTSRFLSYTLQLINQMIKYNDFVRELLARGCSPHRKSGKHLIYRHPELNRNLVITKAKTISLGIYKECDKLLTSIGA
jgi:predicted RNA binding protein YcfA (HicA-like mRNA interferase family)